VALKLGSCNRKWRDNGIRVPVVLPNGEEGTFWWTTIKRSEHDETISDLECFHNIYVSDSLGNMFQKLQISRIQILWKDGTRKTKIHSNNGAKVE